MLIVSKAFQGIGLHMRDTLPDIGTLFVIDHFALGVYLLRSDALWYVHYGGQSHRKPGIESVPEVDSSHVTSNLSRP